MKILALCTSTSSAAAMRWRWRRGFGRHWRLPNRPWFQRLRVRRQNPNSPKRSSGSLVTKVLWEEASSTSPCHATTSTYAMDAAIPGSMGMNTPLNFQFDGKNAAINGDFMLLPAELNPVIKVLRANGIEVASVHNHMLDDEPRLIFIISGLIATPWTWPKA